MLSRSKAGIYAHWYVCYSCISTVRPNFGMKIGPWLCVVRETFSVIELLEVITRTNMYASFHVLRYPLFKSVHKTEFRHNHMSLHRAFK